MSDQAGRIREYNARLEHLDTEVAAARHQYGLAMVLAAVLGLAVVASVWASITHGTLPLWLCAFAVPAPLLAGGAAGRKLGLARELRILQTFYRAGVARLEHRWMGNGCTGEQYGNDAHLYAADLDLFGEGSLFELMCVARTATGKDTLARWMREPATKEEATERQEAVRELSGALGLRERLVRAGTRSYSDSPGEALARWLDAPPVRFPGWARRTAPVLAGAVLTVVALAATGVIGRAVLVPSVASLAGLELMLVAHVRKAAARVRESIGLPAVDLDEIEALMKLIESEPFESARLRFLGDSLRQPFCATKHLRRLRRLVWLLEQGRNELIAAPSWFLLWSTQLAMAIEAWRDAHGHGFQRWLMSLGEFEALHSLAVYAYEHASDPFPELLDSGTLFEAEEMRHPLLGRDCVPNDLSLGSGNRFLLVSGSNMSGKSTYLRAAGLNAVLAFMGAPVRARSLRTTLVRVAAAIRIEDSLMHGRSRFFAEVSRLREMIALAESGQPVLFLIDEILGGTNSRDRAIAAEAVARALVEGGAIGLITTHDLALS